MVPLNFCNDRQLLEVTQTGKWLAWANPLFSIGQFVGSRQTNPCRLDGVGLEGRVRARGGAVGVALALRAAGHQRRVRGLAQAHLACALRTLVPGAQAPDAQQMAASCLRNPSNCGP